jgi:hypothetical protein
LILGPSISRRPSGNLLGAQAFDSIRILSFCEAASGSFIKRPNLELADVDGTASLDEGYAPIGQRRVTANGLARDLSQLIILNKRLLAAIHHHARALAHFALHGFSGQSRILRIRNCGSAILIPSPKLLFGSKPASPGCCCGYMAGDSSRRPEFGHRPATCCGLGHARV